METYKDKIQKIISGICEYFNISEEDLISKSRKQLLVKARFFCCLFLRNTLKLSFATIGQLLGKRDHSTVIHAIAALENDIELIKVYRNDLVNLKIILTSIEIECNE